MQVTRKQVELLEEGGIWARPAATTGGGVGAALHRDKPSRPKRSCMEQPVPAQGLSTRLRLVWGDVPHRRASPLEACHVT